MSYKLQKLIVQIKLNICERSLDESKEDKQWYWFKYLVSHIFTNGEGTPNAERLRELNNVTC